MRSIHKTATFGIALLPTLMGLVQSCESTIEMDKRSKAGAKSSIVIESAEASDEQVSLTWQSVAEASSYEALIATDADCASTLASTKIDAASNSSGTMSTKINVTIEGSGKAYVCITAIDKQGQTIKGSSAKGYEISVKRVSAPLIVADPTFSVAAGTYTTAQTVSISTATPGATIYYTTDGSTPTTSSNVYSTALNVAATQTIKALAIKSAFINSAVSSAAYTIDPTTATPEFSVAGGVHHSTKNVSLSSTTSGAAIYYTTNGSTPTTSSTLYSTPIIVSATTTLKAFATKAGLANSSVATATYTINALTSSAIEAFPVTTNFPTVSWTPTVKFSLASPTTIGLFGDQAGTGINTPSAAIAGTNTMQANALTSAGLTNSVYARDTASLDYVNMGSYTTKLPPSMHLPGVSGSVWAIVKDAVTTGCTAAPHCMIIGGGFWSFGNQHVNNIFRLKADGTIEQLGTGLNGSVITIVTDNAGNIYAGGMFKCAGGSVSSGTYPANTCSGSGGTTVLNKVAKWDGSSWSGLDTGLETPSQSEFAHVRYLTIDSSGNLFAKGSFFNCGANTCLMSAKWNGAIWSDGGYIGAWNTPIVADHLGNVYSGGSNGEVKKWNGTSWSALGSGTGFPFIRALIVDSAGNLYAGGPGGDVTPQSTYAAKWNGTSWTTLGTLSDAYNISSFTFDSGGNLIAGMYEYQGGSYNGMLRQWNGSSWTTISTTLYGSRYAAVTNTLAFDGSGTLFAGGNFTVADNTSASGIAKWNGSNWAALTSGQGVDNEVMAMRFDSTGKLYSAGAFKRAGGVTVNNVGLWDGSTWSALGSGFNGPVSAIAMNPSGTGPLYAAGAFTMSGATAVNRVAAWDGSAWSAVGTGAPDWNSVNSIAVNSAGYLYAAGSITTGGYKIAQWDGTTWTVIGTGSGAGSLVFDNSGSLYATSSGMTVSGGGTANGVIKWNGTDWNRIGAEFYGVGTLSFDSSGNFYMGGSFQCAAGSTATGEYPGTTCSGGGGTTVYNNIARWNGTAWVPLGQGLDNAVSTIRFDSSGNLYAGGYFTMAGGIVSKGIAKWNGSSWTTAGNGINGSVSALAFDSSGNMFLGGLFSTTGAVLRTNFVKWMPAFNSWF